MNRRNYIKRIDYIYWKKEAILEKIDNKKFNEIKDKLKEEGTKISYSTIRDNYKDNYYSIRRKYNNLTIYLYKDNQYYLYYTNSLDDSKNERKKAYGYEGLKMVKQKFQEDYNMSFKKAFGYVEEEFKTCVPKIFSYSRANCYNKIIKTSSVDFSSHWPYNVGGILPDAHKMLKFEGTVAPTEEYPFAFYLNSGHVAEYNRFDSHNWLNSTLRDAMFRHSRKKEDFPQNELLDPEKDITILMKASEYELGKYYEYFYDLREEDPDAKLYANASLGYMHRKNYDRYKMAHIVAIVLGRAQSETIKAMNEIGECYVVHAVVDGFIYRGSLQLGEDEKRFGNLHQEWIGLDTKIKATNAYIVMNKDKCIKVKHGGYECYKDGTEITKETVKDFNDFDNWISKRSVEDGETLQEEQNK